jgi:hypothetical protein
LKSILEITPKKRTLYTMSDVDYRILNNALTYTRLTVSGAIEAAKVAGVPLLSVTTEELPLPVTRLVEGAGTNIVFIDEVSEIDEQMTEYILKKTDEAKNH